ncbi:MAG: hypothetical protein QNJ97_15735 [Myxococcota bacterium]|nr:hypothetical protein [Myxococcota bacterium]
MQSKLLILKRAVTHVAMMIMAMLPVACIHTVAHQERSRQRNLAYTEAYFARILPLDNGALMPEGWRLENYQLDEHGKPAELKFDPDEQGIIWLDVDGDGKEGQVLEYPLYVARFLNTDNDSTIWLRALPYSIAADQAKFSVVMRRFVDDFSRMGHKATCVERKQCTSGKQRYATRIVSADEAVVFGYPAYIAVVEVANLSRVELSDDSPREYMEIVMIRTDFLWESDQSTSAFPVLLIGVHSSFKEDFEEGRGIFRDFIGRLSLELPDALPQDARTATLLCAEIKDTIRLKIGKYNTIVSNRGSKQRHEAVWIKKFQVRSPDMDREEIACLENTLVQSDMQDISGAFVVRKQARINEQKTLIPRLPVSGIKVKQGETSTLDSGIDETEEMTGHEDQPCMDDDCAGHCDPPCGEKELCTKGGHCVPQLEQH